MKPIKLVIQAFGPFAQTETINFSDLGENPLFLINGPTGAGKSSILDAICFALYGQTTGKEREAGHMRCDFSANDLQPGEPQPAQLAPGNISSISAIRGSSYT